MPPAAPSSTAVHPSGRIPMRSEKTIGAADSSEQAQLVKTSRRRNDHHNTSGVYTSRTAVVTGQRALQARLDRGSTAAAERVSRLPRPATQPQVLIPDPTPNSLLEPAKFPTASPLPTAVSETPALSRNALPYASQQPPLSVAECKHTAQHHAKVNDERNKAKAALEGTSEQRSDIPDDLPDFLREWYSKAKRNDPVGPNRQVVSYQPYRPNQHLTPLPTRGLKPQTAESQHSSNHARLSRAIEHCEFDLASVSAQSSTSASLYSTDVDGRRLSATAESTTQTSPQRISRKPLNPNRLNAALPLTPLPFVRPDTGSTFLVLADTPEQPASPAHVARDDGPRILNDEATQECQNWRPESWNPIRDLKECFSGWDGLKKQVLKERYRHQRK